MSASTKHRSIFANSGRQAQRACLAVRMLEDRLVPANFTVNSLADIASPPPGMVTLRSAITAANLDQSNDTIGFATGLSGAINLTSPLPTIATNLQINGPGANTLAVMAPGGAQTANSVFALASNPVNVSVSGLTVDGNGSYQGVLVASGATLTLNGCTIRNGRASIGGGLEVVGGAAVVTNCTVSANAATSNGGGLADLGGALTVVQSTIANNGAGIYGGGIYGYSVGTSVSIYSSTIAENILTSNSGTAGGGIYEYLYPIALHDSVVAGNSEFSNAAALPDDVNGAIDATSDHNLIGATINTTGLITRVNGNMFGTDTVSIDPLLGPLQDNGGPTYTMMPLPGSPLIDHGAANTTFDSITALDQRGLPRKSVFANAPMLQGGNGRDIGAVEVQAAAPTILTVNTLSDAANPPASSLTLRQAIGAANGTLSLASLPAAQVQAGSPYQTVIQFSVTGVIGLTTPLPAVAVDTSVTGPGPNSLTIKSLVTGNSNAVISVAPGAQAALSGLTLDGNNSSTDVLVTAGAIFTLDSSVVQDGRNDYGGGLNIVGGSVTITNCTITNNNANSNGGGVSNRGGSLSIFRSTIAGNQAVYGGGGVYDFASETGGANLSIDSSAVTGNSTGALGDGGGLAIYWQGPDPVTFSLSEATFSGNSSGYGGAVYLEANHGGLEPPLTIADCTIAGNSDTAASAEGAGVNDVNSDLVLSCTAVAKNANANGAEDDVLGTVDAISDHSLIGSAAGMTGVSNGANGNIVGAATSPVDPKIGPLQNNGGPTLTMAPLVQSPLLNAGSGAVTQGSDQRGVLLMTQANIGAYQATASALQFSNLPPLMTVGVPANFAVAAVDSFGESALGYRGKVTVSSTDAQAGLPPAHTYSLSEGGTHGFSTTLNSVGNQTITATDAVNDFSVTSNSIAVAPAAPQVMSVVIDGGAAQRSEVRTITVTFSGPIRFAGGNTNAAAAFQLTHVSVATNVILAATVSADAVGRTVVTLTFSGSETDAVSAQNGGAPSLADGRYSLTVLSGSVSGPTGKSLDGGGPGGNYVSPSDTLGGGPGELGLYRLFGDATGNGIVDASDLGQFRATYNANSSNSTYLAFLDADNNGAVDSQDLGQFRSRFNASVF